MGVDKSGTVICLVVVACMGISCAEKPRVDTEERFSPQVIHARFTLDCSACHEQERLPPTLGVAHGFGRDCGECHNSVDDPTGVERPWTPLPFDHTPEPNECMGCHALDRPVRDSHPQEGDCVTCHGTNAWLPPKIGR